MIFGKFKKGYRKSKKNIKFCNFPDGIGNLLLDPLSFKEKIKIAIKSLLKYFGYFSYYYYSGDRMGMRYFDKVYSFMPELLKKKKINNVELIKELTMNKINTKQSLLFLGQPLENHLNKRSLVELYEKTAVYLSQQGYTELYYKKHHRESSNVAFEIFSNYDFKLLEDSRCIEEISYEKGFNCVVSFVSSALPQLKLLFGNQIECISINSDYVLKAITKSRKSLDQLNTIFNMFGVRKVNI
jgi:Alpha-2,8-polysialyltransferase (POLYST)